MDQQHRSGTPADPTRSAERAAPVPTGHMRVLLSLADQFEAMFDGWTVRGTAPLHRIYGVRLMTPQGASTRDGQLAVQHILLTLGRKAALTIGSAHHEEHRIQLRTLEYLRAAHDEHVVDAPLDLDGESYEGLLAQLERFFAEFSFQVSRVDAAAALTRTQVVRRTRSALAPSPNAARIWGVLAAAVFATAVVMGLLWRFVIAAGH